MKSSCLLLIATYFFFINSLSAQKTYPVFENVLDHSVSDDVHFLGDLGNRLVYLSKVNGVQKLWITDGTAAGTKLVSTADQSEVRFIHNDIDAFYFTEKRGSTFFISRLSANVDSLTQIHMSGIRYDYIFYWKDKFSWFERSAGGGYDKMQLLDPLTGTVTTLVNPGFLRLRAIGGGGDFLYYVMVDTDGMKLGKSDGTIANTAVFATLSPDDIGFGPYNVFYSNGSKVYFFLYDAGQSFNLWTTDGTANGTIQLGQYEYPDFGWPTDPYIFLDDKLLFNLRELDAPSGTTFEFHATDGTVPGTVTLDTDPNDYTEPKDMTLFNSRIYYISYITGGAELRATDGTIQGTEQILSAYGHQNGSIGGINSAGRFNDDLILQAYEPDHGSELYHSDGTAAGTSLLSDVIRGETDGNPGNFMQVGNRLFFTSYYEDKNRLWIYDPVFEPSCDSFRIGETTLIHVTDSTAGSIHLSPEAGQQPYLYSLNGGTPGTSSQFDNLPIGEYYVEIIDNLGCEIVDTFLIEETTGIETPEYLKSMAITPNPTTTENGFVVEFELDPSHKSAGLSIDVHNLAGQLFYHHDIIHREAYIRVPVDTRQYPAGQYVMSLMEHGKLIGSASVILQ